MASKHTLVATDDLYLVNALEQTDIRIHEIPWGCPLTDVPDIDGFLVRSPYDYILAPHRFRHWMQSINQFEKVILNSLSTLEWNMDKHYLSELEAADIFTVPTYFINAGDRTSLSQIQHELDCPEVIVKRTVSAGGHFMHRISNPCSAADEEIFQTELQSHDLMVQPLITSIQTCGEWSLVFIDRKFSHAVLKRPKENEFRVHQQHGGSLHFEKPDPNIIEQAAKILNHVETPCIYARIDGYVADQKFILMELELIEPELFFRLQPTSARDLAEVIKTSIS